MTNEERRRSEELRRKIKRDRVFLNNPVVMQGLGLAPLVVAATSLKNAVILGVAVLLLLTLTRILAAMLSRFSYFRFRGLTLSLIHILRWRSWPPRLTAWRKIWRKSILRATALWAILRTSCARP